MLRSLVKPFIRDDLPCAAIFKKFDETLHYLYCKWDLKIVLSFVRGSGVLGRFVRYYHLGVIESHMHYFRFDAY